MARRATPRPAANDDSLVTPAPDVERLAGPALRTFFAIVEAWRLTNDEAMKLLGDPPRSTFYEWKRAGEGRLQRDTLERISYVLGIYKALQILLPDAAAADRWIRQPNTAPLFGGRSALDRLLSGNVGDLFVVRQYLDAVRGGG